MNQIISEYFSHSHESYSKLASKISPSREKKLELFQEKLSIKFEKTYLLEKALIHRSWYNTRTKSIELLYNQRLEFLGDSILSSVISEYVFCNYTYLDEGGLSRLKASVVSRKTLSRIATDLDIGSVIRVGKGEMQAGTPDSSSICGDALEAIIGAYYIDAGYEKCSEFIVNLFEPIINTSLQKGRSFNYKSMLQEIVQKREHEVPKYKITRTEGPSHKKEFWVTVEVKNQILAEGQGFSKKDAEIRAAKAAIRSHFNDVIGEISAPASPRTHSAENVELQPPPPALN